MMAVAMRVATIIRAVWEQGICFSIYTFFGTALWHRHPPCMHAWLTAQASKSSGHACHGAAPGVACVSFLRVSLRAAEEVVQQQPPPHAALPLYIVFFCLRHNWS